METVRPSFASWFLFGGGGFLFFLVEFAKRYSKYLGG